MYSLSDILRRYVKKENTEGSSCDEQSSKTLFSNDTIEYSTESGNPVIPRARHELDPRTSSLPFTSKHLVSLQEEISPREDYLKIRKRQVQGTLSNKKRFKVDLAHRNRETSTSTTCSMAQLMSLTSPYPIPFFREIGAQEDVQMSNTMPSYKQGLLPFKSAINPLHSSDDFKAKEDETWIQISKVYENPYNEKAIKAFIDDLTKKQCHLPLKNGDNQIAAHSKRQEMSLSKKQPIQQNRKMSLFTNGSGVLNRSQFTKTTAPKKELLRFHSSCETPTFQTTISADQRTDQHPQSAYQMDSASTRNVSVYQHETKNYSRDNSSLEIIPCYHIYNIRPSSPDDKNPHLTVTPQHLRIIEEITAQQDDLAKNIEIYKPEISLPNQKGKRYSQKDISAISINLSRSADSSQSCRQEQPQRQAFDHPASPLETPRPSVIMVPASWSNISSRGSHVPLKVDAPLILQSYRQMGNVVDLDLSDEDDDGEKEKYLRVNMDGKTATFKLTKEDWRRIPISSFPSGGRLLAGDWRKIFIDKVKESNPWCSLRFKNNHVRSENSRKIYSAVFFRGAAECKRPECNVKVRFVIQKERGKYVDVTYVGNVCHSSQPGGGSIVPNRIRRTQNN